MLALRQSLRTAVRPARTFAAVRPYSDGKIREEIKEDKEGWTENREVSRTAGGARRPRADQTSRGRLRSLAVRGR